MNVTVVSEMANLLMCTYNYGQARRGKDYTVPKLLCTGIQYWVTLLEVNQAELWSCMAAHFPWPTCIGCNSSDPIDSLHILLYFLSQRLPCSKIALAHLRTSKIKQKSMQENGNWSESEESLKESLEKFIRAHISTSVVSTAKKSICQICGYFKVTIKSSLLVEQ